MIVNFFIGLHASCIYISTNAQFCCRHGPSAYRSCFAFESRLRDFKDCALLVANNRGVGKRALELMRERWLLFPGRPATLFNQKWLQAGEIVCSFADPGSVDEFLQQLGWRADQQVLAGDKIKLGSLTLSTRDGYVYCPMGSSPSDGYLSIVVGLCYDNGMLRVLMHDTFLYSDQFICMYISVYRHVCGVFRPV